MRYLFPFNHSAIIILCSMFLTACSGSRPDNIGIVNLKLTACPESPNCVSSDSIDKEHHVPAFKLEKAAELVWLDVKAYLQMQQNMQIISQTADYMHIESTSSLMRFVDDFELHLRKRDGIIAVRSASRLGHSDFGVNKQRIEDLYLYLSNKGLVSKVSK